MPTCGSCRREVSAPGRFCPECGAPWIQAPDADPPGSLGSTIPDSRPSSSSSQHGRFEPGTRLGSRYRVVGLLGRGGMGEVYRADDLELSQSVALKFLPEKVARNATDLARLRREVRVARQIAHPNVCRTYDIAEVEGQVFVVMEYVDGEDLASVLRRLGRPTSDKALEIARQLCLGIGAAHEAGVLHRDLKPANIMIDGRGRVRITDFGLAGTAEELAAEGAAAGTPAYMAPEQARSGTASAQSDIFSLGLVLYELFTGKRAVDVTPPPDPARPGSDSSVRTPSSLVGNLDPAVERVILRCLERDPSRRPQSAYAVFGALPGGDPLAAAVAAGETPSPELVANAGVEGSVRPVYAGIAVAFVLAALVIVSVLQRPLFSGLDRSPQSLSARAEEVMALTTGRSLPRYSAQGLRDGPASKDSALANAPRGRQYWRRWSSAPLEGTNLHNPGATLAEPPQAYPGSGSVVLDTRGRLLALSVIPDSSSDSAASVASWADFLRAAGRNPVTAVPVVPRRLGRARADTVAAWTVSPPGAPETTLVAAALRGRVVELDTYAGATALGDLGIRVPVQETGLWVYVFVIVVIPFIGSLLLSVRNVRAGRVDLRGAFVTAMTTVVLYLLNYLFTVNLGELGFPHVLASVMGAEPFGHFLIHGVSLFVAYLAIEPYVRRLWPRVLVSWARLVSGRVQDPILGRDVLIGAVVGATLSLLDEAYRHLSRHLGFVTEAATVSERVLASMIAPSALLASASISLAIALVEVMAAYTLLVVLRFLLRNNRAATVALTLLFSFAFVTYGVKSTWLEMGVSLLSISLGVFIFIRYGLVAAVVAVATGFLFSDVPWTTDLSTWFAPQTIMGWVIVTAFLVYGFVTAIGGRQLFRDPLSDPVGMTPRRNT